MEKPQAMTEDATKKLEAVRAQRAELESKRNERAAARSVAEQLELEERKLRDLQAITKAEDEHGTLGLKIAAVETPLGVVIVKRPNHVLFKRFQDSGATSTDDVDRIVRPHVVHPSLSEFDRILEELPATLMRCGDAVVRLAGFRAEEVQKKS
jgi:type II secretory pathway component PulM